VFTAPKETPIVVLFAPRHGPTQFVCEQRLQFEPGLIPIESEDEHGNVLARMMLEPGRNLLRYDAIVKVPAVREDIDRMDGAVSPHELPQDVLRYTLPSRYADSDKLRDFAWRNFGHLPNGLGRVQAICDWVHREIEYRTFSGDPTLSASEVIERRFGVCRDLAHAGVALCRTFNIPARYVTGYVSDIGVVNPGTPEDFHAYFEVYVAHRWQTFDARLNIPRIGRVKIAAGYDAGNCAFTTIYGSATLDRFEVWSYQVDAQFASTSGPVDLSQRLDGIEQVRIRR
jgi:transglutaminase-like putative cysteine protease